MKELPSPDKPKEISKPIPGIPLQSKTGGYSTSNRKVAACPVQRVYPWLLFASTAVAATFCLAYITKPVILAGPSPSLFDEGQTNSTVDAATVQPVENELAPSLDGLPGENEANQGNRSGSDTPASPSASDFEETNIRVQHALDASSPGGEVNRIVIDVPVLYQSRNLRWSQQEAAEARILLDRLSLYQENVRALRDQGNQLRNEWNALLEKSIPSQALRVDSPSLPTNQKDQFSPNNNGDTSNSIKLRKPNE
ncbi:hypothetical protein [Luteolibacter sp. AS25]|uniref:hypothetical protein n=1 Tax=Luteolibacter sp. AS25 TaxID=3135776 RepID=UPI00398A8E9A